MKDLLEIQKLVEKSVEEGLNEFRSLNRFKFDKEVANMYISIDRSDRVYDLGSEIGFSKSLAGDIKETQKSIKGTANKINELMDEMAVLVNKSYIDSIKSELEDIIFFDEDNKSVKEIFEQLEKVMDEIVNKKDRLTISSLIMFIKIKFEIFNEE